MIFFLICWKPKLGLNVPMASRAVQQGRWISNYAFYPLDSRLEAALQGPPPADRWCCCKVSGPTTSSSTSTSSNGRASQPPATPPGCRPSAPAVSPQRTRVLPEAISLCVYVEDWCVHTLAVWLLPGLLLPHPDQSAGGILGSYILVTQLHLSVLACV